MIQRGNIFSAGNIPDKNLPEFFEILHEKHGVKIERIISAGQISDNWYDQEYDEWVILLSGNATLVFDTNQVELESGDYVFIPAHCRHKVISTSVEPHCVWLAIHIS